MSRKLFLAVVLLVFLSSNVFALTTLRVPAVDTNGKGVLTTMEARVIGGDGAVFIDVEPYISVDTQQSARIAAEIAADEAGVKLDDYDVLFKILARTQIIDGPSGGAGMALLAYSEFKKLKPRSDMAVTGSIERDGSVGTVGGVYEKAISMKGTGVTLFLVPPGQSKNQGKNVALEAEKIGVQVVEVRNFDDVLKYAFTPEGSRVQPQIFEQKPLVLEKVSTAGNDPLRQISIEEIRSLKSILKSLEGDEDSQVLYESINKSVFEAEYLLEQGYYYSAANLVFVAKISAESAQLEDVEQVEFMRMVQELENKAEKIVFAQTTVENMEWSIGAKLRYYWALNKIKGIKKVVGVTTPGDLHTEYSAAKNWVAAAERMNAIAENIGGPTVAKQEGLKEISLQLISALNESQYFVLDTEIEQHYSGAVSAYESGDYATAFFDGLFAKALSEATDKIEEQVGSEFEENLKDSGDLRDYNNSLWAEYYFIHSLYSSAQANRTNEFVYLANALKLQLLSDSLEENIPLMKQTLSQDGASISYPGGEPLTIKTTVSQTQQNQEALLTAAVALLALLVLALAARALKAKHEVKPLSTVEKIEKLDELLMQGRISEKSWAIMHERYFTQLKKEKTVQTAKPRRKKS